MFNFVKCKWKYRFNKEKKQNIAMERREANLCNQMEIKNYRKRILPGEVDLSFLSEIAVISHTILFTSSLLLRRPQVWHINPLSSAIPKKKRIKKQRSLYDWNDYNIIIYQNHGAKNHCIYHLCICSLPESHFLGYHRTDPSTVCKKF